jgi:hypothetical protein
MGQVGTRLYIFKGKAEGEWKRKGKIENNMLFSSINI